MAEGAMLKGKVAVVTGGTGGIGLAIARALAGEGVNLMLSGLGDPKVIEDMRAGLADEFGVTALYDPADLRHPDQVIALCQRAEAEIGPVDVLCNNAGVLNVPVQRIEEVDPSRWDDTFAVNVTAPFHAIRAVLPGMRQRGWGRIVNTASALGLVAIPDSAPYVASKHAIVGLTRAVALETVDDGITCNAICPGLVQTPFVEDRVRSAAERRGQSFEEVARLALRGRQPAGRFIGVDEVAALVLFLCSPAASAVTGAAMPVDLAWTAM